MAYEAYQKKAFGKTKVKVWVRETNEQDEVVFEQIFILGQDEDQISHKGRVGFTDDDQARAAARAFVVPEDFE